MRDRARVYCIDSNARVLGLLLVLLVTLPIVALVVVQLLLLGGRVRSQVDGAHRIGARVPVRVKKSQKNRKNAREGTRNRLCCLLRKQTID